MSSKEIDRRRLFAVIFDAVSSAIPSSSSEEAVKLSNRITIELVAGPLGWDQVSKVIKDCGLEEEDSNLKSTISTSLKSQLGWIV